MRNPERQFKARLFVVMCQPDLSRCQALGEFVPGYEAYVWDAIGAPRGTPAEIISRLNGTINASLADPEMQARFAALGAEPMIMTPAGFGKFVADETDKWGKVIRAANIK